MTKIKNIIVLCGGESSRLWPLSQKSLFTFLGKTLLEHQLEKLSNLAGNLYVITNEKEEEEVFDIVKPFNAALVVQSGSGQAAAILSINDHISGETLIVNGNDLFEQSLFDDLISKKTSTQADCIFPAIKFENYFPGGYLRHDKDRVLEVLEKPGENNIPSDFVKLVFDYFKNIEDFIEILKNASSQKDDLYETGLTLYIKERRSVRFFQYKGFFATLKYPWDVLTVSQFFLSKVKSGRGKNVVIDDTAIIEGEVYFDDNVKVHGFCKIIGPAWIGKNSIIGNFAFVSNSIIGENCVIGGYSEVTRSRLGDNVWLHRNYIGDSVLADNILFGAGALLANFRFDEKTISSVIKGEKVDTKLKKFGSAIGSNTKIGVNSSVMPGVKIGSGSKIMPGSVVTDDVL